MAENRCISTTRLYSGRVINLDMDRVRYPDGSSGELEIVRHPGASAVLPLMDSTAAGDPRLLLVKQYRYAAASYLYEVPAGRLAPGETPEACARRELLEETGCTTTHLRYLTAIYTTPGFTDELIHLFRASGLTPGTPNHEIDEFIEPAAVPLSRAIRMIHDGLIQDAKTIVAILIEARNMSTFPDTEFP